MNFDTSASTFFDTTLVGNVYEDDEEKLHSDLIGLKNSITLEDVEASDAFAMKVMEDGLEESIQDQVIFIRFKIYLLILKYRCKVTCRRAQTSLTDFRDF